MLQAQCVAWFKMQYPHPIFAIPNGGSRNKIEAAKLKRCGVLAGVPDLFIPYPRLREGTVQVLDCGLFIELKVNKNKLTENQLRLTMELRVFYEVEVCYTFEEFVKVVKEYFGG